MSSFQNLNKKAIWTKLQASANAPVTPQTPTYPPKASESRTKLLNSRRTILFHFAGKQQEQRISLETLVTGLRIPVQEESVKTHQEMQKT